MNNRVTKIRQEDPLNRIQEKKGSKTVRYASFNINGAKTLFNYHPWNQLQQNYDCFFNLLSADIVSLQELKLSSSNISSLDIGNLSKFRSFISLPKTKRGYSGVGLFVRIPEAEEPDSLKYHLTVDKAEEGLTGFLKSPDYPEHRYRDLDRDLLIGGYPDDIDETEALRIDNEGRCVCIELACNVVVFSLYCPANSMGSEEGELYRMEFLRILLKRCHYLKHELGKEVIIMGDINVALDLIDHADTINEKVKKRFIKPLPERYLGDDFEKINYQECINFKTSTPARELLNSYTIPTLKESTSPHFEYQFLYDTTRYIQDRRMGMYTVWNTLTGARQSNYGSRIDFILTSSQALLKTISNADIWPFIMGSDHCPVFTDFESNGNTDVTKIHTNKLKLEARLFYKLVKHRDISQMFSMSGSKNKNPENGKEDIQEPKKRKVQYVSRKGNLTLSKNQQTSIGNFFFKDNSKSSSESVSENDLIADTKSTTPGEFMKPTSIISLSNLIHGQAPKCYHDEVCQLKTSLQNSKTRGKKFWCCPRTRVVSAGDGDNSKVSEYQCSYFKWASNT